MIEKNVDQQFSLVDSVDDAYSLNYLGYDYLAINTLRQRGVLDAVGNQVGVGKESGMTASWTPSTR